MIYSTIAPIVFSLHINAFFLQPTLWKFPPTLTGMPAFTRIPNFLQNSAASHKSATGSIARKMAASSNDMGIKTKSTSENRISTNSSRPTIELPTELADCNLCHYVVFHPPPPRGSAPIKSQIIRRCRAHSLTSSPHTSHSQNHDGAGMQAYTTPGSTDITSAVSPISTASSSPFTPYPEPRHDPGSNDYSHDNTRAPISALQLPSLPSTPITKSRPGTIRTRPTSLLFPTSSTTLPPSLSTPRTAINTRSDGWRSRFSPHRQTHIGEDGEGLEASTPTRVTLRPITPGIVRISRRATSAARSFNSLSSTSLSGASIRLVADSDDGGEETTKTRTLATVKKALQSFATPKKRVSKTPSYPRVATRKLETPKAATTPVAVGMGAGKGRDLKNVLTNVANKLRISPEKVRQAD